MTPSPVDRTREHLEVLADALTLPSEGKEREMAEAVARALSERWNARRRFIYPINSRPEDWIESGDARAVLVALGLVAAEVER